jgi:hypothetical protein
MPSGKGRKCPNCGESKFQRTGKLRHCSNCHRYGWTTKAPPTPGGGKGDYCNVCKKNTLHPLLSERRDDLRLIASHCKGCGATLFRLTRVRHRLSHN